MIGSFQYILMAVLADNGAPMTSHDFLKTSPLRAYKVLRSLEARGMVNSWLAGKTRRRGGKSMRYFDLTTEGLSELSRYESQK